MDVSGSHQLDVSHDIQKKPLDARGQPIGEATKHGTEHNTRMAVRSYHMFHVMM
jgi:hypothetical protein